MFSIRTKGPAASAAIVAACVCIAAAAYFFAVWGIGNALAVRADTLDIAKFAISLATDDPQAHYTAGVLYERTFVPEDLPRSLAEFEKATALSPHNYLLWLELGKARERSGDADGAEAALRKALSLAPNYSSVQWALGNALLRSGKPEEAFEYVRKAALGSGEYLAPAAGIAMDMFDGDAAAVRRALGDSPAMNSALAVYLAGHKRYDEAMEFWNRIPDDDKRGEFKAQSEALMRQFIDAKKFGDAAAVYSVLNAGAGEMPARGHITNGGFETGLKARGASLFEWNVAEGELPQVAMSGDQRHGGSQSLWIIFNTTETKDFRQIAQTVLVEPGASYEFEAFYRAELKTSARIVWEVVDAADGKVMASTPAAANTVEWAPLHAAFTVPANSDAVVIRLTLAGCASPVCPVTGRLWFDDLSLRNK